MKSNSRSTSRNSGGLTPISNESVLDGFQEKEQRARKETADIVQQVLYNRPKWNKAAAKKIMDDPMEQIVKKNDTSEMSAEDLAKVIKGMTKIMNNDKVIKEKDTVFPHN
jgi:hypothetical protein